MGKPASGQDTNSVTGPVFGGQRKKVLGAAYKTFGCPASIASASMVAELVEGLDVSEALAINEATLTQALGGLPEGKDHCPRLAIEALRRALSSYEEH